MMATSASACSDAATAGGLERFSSTKVLTNGMSTAYVVAQRPAAMAPHCRSRRVGGRTGRRRVGSRRWRWEEGAMPGRPDRPDGHRRSRVVQRCLVAPRGLPIFQILERDGPGCPWNGGIEPDHHIPDLYAHYGVSSSDYDTVSSVGAGTTGSSPTNSWPGMTSIQMARVPGYERRVVRRHRRNVAS
jgi:hypothetical protein